jgi:hypothetical protein
MAWGFGIRCEGIAGPLSSFRAAHADVIVAAVVYAFECPPRAAATSTRLRR